MKTTILNLASLVLAASAFAGSPVIVTASCSGKAAGWIETGKKQTTPVSISCEENKLGTARLVREFIFPASSKNEDRPKVASDFEKRDVGLVIEVTVSRHEGKIAYRGRCLVTKFVDISGIDEDDSSDTEPLVVRFATRECFFSGDSKVGAPVSIRIGDKADNDGVLNLTFEEKGEPNKPAQTDGDKPSK